MVSAVLTSNPNRLFASSFNKAPKKKLPVSQPVLPKKKTVDLRGDGDCAFRAIAAGIFNRIMNLYSRNEALYNVIFERFHMVWPDYAHIGTTYSRPEERLQLLLNDAQSIAKVGYTLRCIAVQEIIENPEKYPGAYVADGNDTSVLPLNMIKPTTFVDETVLAALANALQVPIQVEARDSVNDIPLIIQYGPICEKDDLQSPVEVEKLGGHYRARLDSPVLIQAFEAAPPQSLAALPEYIPALPSEDEMIQRTIAADKKILKTFEEHYDTLTDLVISKGITKDQLLDIYIKGIGTSDYLQGRVKYVRAEYNGQDFFERAIESAKSRQRGVGVVAQEEEPQFEEPIMNELMHAIARATSIKQLDFEKVCEQLEEGARGTMFHSIS